MVFPFLQLHHKNEKEFKIIIAHQLRLSTLFNLFVRYNLKLAKQPRNDRWKDDETSFIFITQYFWLVESAFSFIINWIIYTLIRCNNIKLVIRKKKINVNDFYRLNIISLSDRLSYIETNGFPNLSLLLNTNIRNSIAHTNYDIKKDGTVTFYSRNNKIISEKTKDEIYMDVDNMTKVYREFNVIISQRCDTMLGYNSRL